jgi:hypothetical protein
MKLATSHDGAFDNLDLEAAQKHIVEQSESLEFSAVRLLTQNQPGFVERYRSLDDFIRSTPSLSSMLVATSLLEKEFNYLQNADVERGSLDRDALLPVLKMAWCPGVTLGKFVVDCCKRGDTANLSALRSLVAGLSQECRLAHFVHGDLSPDNILVVDNGGELELKLVDYDSVLFPGIENLPSLVGLTQMRHPESIDRTLDDDLVAFAIYDLVLEFLIENHELIVMEDRRMVDEVETAEGLFEQRFLLGRDDFLSESSHLSPIAKRVQQFAGHRFGLIRDCLSGPYSRCAVLENFSEGVQPVSGVFLRPVESAKEALDEFLGWINLERFELWDSEPNFLIRNLSSGADVYRFFASEKSFNEAREIVKKAGYEMPTARAGGDALVDARFLADDARLKGQWIWFVRSPDDFRRLAWRGAVDGDVRPFVFEEREPSEVMLVVGKKRVSSEGQFLVHERRPWHAKVLYSCHVDLSAAPDNFYGRLKFFLDHLLRTLIRRREFVEMLWQGIEVSLLSDVVENAISSKVGRATLEEEILSRFARVTGNRLWIAEVRAEIRGGLFRLVPN